MLLRDIFNEYKWRHDSLESLEVVVLHRGARDDQFRITGLDILEIGSKGLFIAANTRVAWEMALVAEAEQRTFIPWHRVLSVNTTDGPIWVRGAR